MAASPLISPAREVVGLLSRVWTESFPLTDADQRASRSPRRSRPAKRREGAIDGVRLGTAIDLFGAKDLEDDLRVPSSTDEN